ncbi:NAD(P)/FAD-dependent oxidoreductase [Methyloceanibacter stevinii]|uniref:NAD(P)/FAD-dependent oxidoreductase n=1 Tax=Methyloceanibacter stevinii TaxID=1774970 RepID=UPI000AE84F65|nr:FAD-dependent oxidoreductase [Methyloceanibacter stevinii]
MEQSASSKYVIIGAGIHGLSTAYHLALQLKATGKGSGEDILVIDKASIGGGASGIACGVVRNNYFQPAMRELMAHSVGVWESDPKAYSYHPVGYMQISAECMHSDVATIYEQQQAIDYESTFIEGTDDCRKYMLGIFDDWQAQGITSVLHEKRGATPTIRPRSMVWPVRPRQRACGSRPVSRFSASNTATTPAPSPAS